MLSVCVYKLIIFFSLNYGPLLNKGEQELDRWKGLPISLIGRVNCILKKGLGFIFTMDSSFSYPFLKNLNSLITFFWQVKISRINQNKSPLPEAL